MFDNTEKSKRDKYDAFAQQTGASFVSLVMEANGGWSRCAQKHLNKVILRYAMRKGVAAVAAKMYWRRRFWTSLRRMVGISLRRRIATRALGLLLLGQLVFKSFLMLFNLHRHEA